MGRKSKCSKRKRPISSSYLTNNLSISANKQLIYLPNESTSGVQVYGLNLGISEVRGNIRETKYNGVYAHQYRYASQTTSHFSLELSTVLPNGSQVVMCKVGMSGRLEEMPLTVSHATPNTIHFHQHFTTQVGAREIHTPRIKIPTTMENLPVVTNGKLNVTAASQSQCMSDCISDRLLCVQQGQSENICNGLYNNCINDCGVPAG